MAVTDSEIERKRERIFADIIRERYRQDDQWGGPSHDDDHTVTEWIGFIAYQARLAQESQSRMWLAETNEVRYVNRMDARARLVKLAALAVAALESYDRICPQMILVHEADCASSPEVVFDAQGRETGDVKIAPCTCEPLWRVQE